MAWWAKSGLVFLGAGVGANARYWLAVLLAQRSVDFPVGTLVVNVSGCLVIGVVMALAMAAQWDQGWLLLVAIGALGGYTTFSTFGFETVRLLQQGKWGGAALYVGLSNGLGIGASALGYWVGLRLSG